MYLEDLKTYRCNNKCNKEEWNQGHLMHQGIHNEEAERKAKENGLEVIYTRYMMEEHKRLFGSK